ncbi:hypothetical protein EE612_055141, partial [Oryza sativa]
GNSGCDKVEVEPPKSGQPGEIHAEFFGEGNNDARGTVIGRQRKNQPSQSKEVRATAREEVAVRTKAKEGVVGEAKDTHSITFGRRVGKS